VRAHAGLVRCGACRGIFDAREHLIEGVLASSDDDEQDAQQSPRTILAGIPPVRNAPLGHEARASPVAADPYLAPREVAREAAKDVGRAAGNDAPAGSHISGSAHSERISADVAHWANAVRNVDVNAEANRAQESISTSSSTPHLPASDDAVHFRWRNPDRTLTPWQRVIYGFFAIVALAALIVQTGYWFRDEIASRVPAAIPALAALCQPIGCRVGPPKRATDLGFVGADLASDPAHKGLLVFTATLRNTGNRATAFPSLVLTLEGVGGEPLARKVFAPEQYAPANASLARGLDGGAEMEIKLYLDASPASPVGFKVDHAYL
jgi:hypothetical protein